ncbi:MAG: enoyl-CoA hydratase/isomerase family protein [Terriglobia bacterium]
MEGCPVPVIGAINGIAAGGGCELALACHLRIASTKAQFSLPKTKL